MEALLFMSSSTDIVVISSNHDVSALFNSALLFPSSCLEVSTTRTRSEERSSTFSFCKEVVVSTSTAFGCLPWIKTDLKEAQESDDGGDDC